METWWAQSLALNPKTGALCDCPYARYRRLERSNPKSWNGHACDCSRAQDTGSLEYRTNAWPFRYNNVAKRSRKQFRKVKNN
eukprot:363889-Chlamydomonas_euryale.AAC.10